MLSDDLLPQPYRTVNKIVQGIVSAALDEIGKRLRQGCIVDKQFVVPRTMPTVPLHLQRITTPIDAPSARPAASVAARSNSMSTSSSAPLVFVTCSRLGQGECIQGLSNGAVRIVTSDGTEPEYTSLPIVAGPVVSVAVSRPLYTEPVYAVASSSSVVLVAVDVRDATPPPSPVPVSGHNGVACRVVSTITSQQLADAVSGNFTAATTQKKASPPSVSTVRLSLDGLTIAIGLDGDSVVAVFALPPPPPVAPPSSANPLSATQAVSPTSSTTPGVTPEPVAPPTEAAQFLLLATPPSADPTVNAVTSPTSPTAPGSANSSGDAFVTASFDFFCRPYTQSTSLGYFKEHRGKQPFSAVSLLVAWCGSAAISKFPLTEFYTNSQDAVQEAKKILQAAAQQQAANAASTSAAATSGAAGKAGKGGKGAAAATASGASGDGAAATSSGIVPAYPEIFFNGRRDLQLSQKIITAVFDEDKQRCAVGCLNGLVVVHDGTTLCNTFTAASHRLKQQTINELVPVSLQFLQPSSLQQLVVGFAVQRLPHRCFVDVYDLSNGRLRRSGPSRQDNVAQESNNNTNNGAQESNNNTNNVAQESNNNTNTNNGAKVANGGATAEQVAPSTQQLPPFCLSRMKYLNRLRAAIPIGGLPLAIVLIDQGAFVLDTTRGDIIAKLREASDAFLHGSLLGNLPSVGSGEPPATDALGAVLAAVGVDEAIHEAHVAAKSFAVVSADSVLFSAQGARRLLETAVAPPAAAAAPTSPPARGTRSPSETSMTSTSHPPADLHNNHNSANSRGISRNDDFSVFRMDSAALVSEMYPALEPLLSTTYGQLPPLLLQALRQFFYDVPHSRRNHPQSPDILGQLLATLQQAQHQVATLHHGMSTAGGAGGKSAQPSLAGTMASRGADGRVSRNSTQSKVTAGKQTLRPSVTPAATSAGISPSSGVSGGSADDASATNSWTGSIRAHISQREDTRHLRKDRVHDFWEAMKKR